MKMNSYVMVGAPGSGKSTKAKEIAELEEAVIVSGDDIRAELYGSAEIQGNWAEVHDRIEEKVAEAAGQGKTVVLDGTHYLASYRREALAMLRSYGYSNVAAVVVNPSLATCLARNFKRRERNVPDYVVKGMHEKLQSSLRHIDIEGFSRLDYIL